MKSCAHLLWLLILTFGKVVRSQNGNHCQEGPSFQPFPAWPSSPNYGPEDIINLSCDVTNATGVFVMTWSKDGTVLSSNSRIHFSNKNQTINISPILQASDAGMYSCEVQDSSGRNCSYANYVNVNVNPQPSKPRIIYTLPQSGRLPVVIGNDVRIACAFDNKSLIATKFHWIRNGSIIKDQSQKNKFVYDIGQKDGNEILYLNISNVMMNDLGEYQCLGMNLVGNESKSISLYIPKDDGNKLTLVIILAVSGVLILAIGGFVFSYFKWRRKKSEDIFKIDEAEFDVPSHDVEFDVFISYSNDDHDWVKGQLFKQLDEMGFKVNIDFKDFTPGMGVVENIMASIYKSRKTVVVMSKNFLKSMWGQFELQQAHQRAIAQRKDVLILLKYDKCKVPSRLLGQTFLDWSDDHIKPHFWTRLRQAIGEPGKGYVDRNNHETNDLDKKNQLDSQINSNEEKQNKRGYLANIHNDLSTEENDDEMLSETDTQGKDLTREDSYDVSLKDCDDNSNDTQQLI